MSREVGCVECPRNTYSKGGAMSCTLCPDYKLSPSGSESEASCFSSGLFYYEWVFRLRITKYKYRMSL